MTWSAINTAIAAVLNGVAGLGQVHAYRRLCTDDASFKAAYTTGGIINAWEISRTATLEDRQNQRASDPVQSILRYTWTLYGYYGIRDAMATEQTFQQLIEDIAEAFRGDVTLGGVVEWTDGIQVVTVDRREFYNVAVHYAELQLPVLEFLDP